MISDPRIRELERLFAKFWQKPGRRTYQFISPANDLILQRRMRIFCRALFADKTFHRLIKHLDDTMPATMGFGLMLLHIWVSTGITRKVGKRLRNKYLQAQTEVE